MTPVAALVLAIVLLLVAKKGSDRHKKKLTVQPFVICCLRGGLGNQLFQIACAYTFAKQHNKELLITHTPLCGKRAAYWTSWTHAFSHLAVDDAFLRQTVEKGVHRYEEVGMKYRPIPSITCILDGYF
jgi:hypothetical protein